MSVVHNLRKAVRLPHRHHHGVDLSHPARSPLGSSVVNCVVYLDGVRQIGDCPAREAVEQVRRKSGDGFVWIGLHEPSAEEFSEMADLFGLHPLAVGHALRPHQRPRMERYDDTLLTVFKTVRYVEHPQLTSTSEVVETGDIIVFTGHDYVITVRHGGHGSLGPIRECLEADPAQLSKGPSAVLHAIADQVVERYLAVTEAVQDDIDAVEAEVFSDHRGSGADSGRIYQLKRELLEFKRAVTPLLRPLHQLAEEPSLLLSKDIRQYFRDVTGHLTRVNEQIIGYDVLLDSILQANVAQVTVAQNEDMRKISAWVAVLAVPTMACAVYGMNFDHMPELHWKYGYPLVLGVILVSCFLVHRGFRRNGWL